MNAQRPFRWLMLAALAVLFAATLSSAQVRPVQDGRALDANPMVGARGTNTGISTSRFNSNLYVTGQVTGLGRFRGGVPYRAENQLGITLPSAATISNFLAESVGVGDVTYGRPLTTSPYFDRQRTIVSRQQRDFSESLRVGVPIENLSDTTRRELYLDASEGYQGIQGAGEGAIALPPGRTYDQGSESILSPATRDMRGASGRLASRIAAPVPGLMGLQEAEDRYRLAREITELDPEAARSPILDIGQATGRRKPVEESLADPASNPMESSPGQSSQGAGQDQDTFVEVMKHLRLKRLQEQGQDVPGRQEPLSADANVRIGSEREVVIERLAGKSSDALNTYMRTAESQLQQGRFYEAADLFKRAGYRDPSNPLPQVGAGLALFAAGEPVSAADQIRRAFAEFPALMETRISAEQMLPGGALRKQLRQLEDLMEKDVHRDDPEMLLMASFLSKATGQSAQARQYARRLSEAGKGDRLYKAYSQYLLTGKRPSGAGLAPQAPARSGPGE